MLRDFYKGKKVFVTGHTGFKGSWLTLWLKSMGAEVLGYSLEPNTQPSMFEELRVYGQCRNEFGNILDFKKLISAMKQFKPEIVFHLAAQPIVRLSYTEPIMTYQTNVMGSLNVLEAARQCGSVVSFVNITTDKCYENKEVSKGYKEDEPMGGYDMYSSSKACVEIMSSSFRRSFLQSDNEYAMATARAGNVIGGGDWAAERLIPDCVRSINAGKQIEIRNPLSVRPWQFVLEPLSGYLLLGKKLFEEGKKYAEAFNFGPYEDSILKVEDVVQKVIDCYGKGTFTVQKNDNLHEANLLMLNIEKAEKVLGWKPAYSSSVSIQKTVEWYKNFYENADMLEFTMNQISEYEENFLWNKNCEIK